MLSDDNKGLSKFALMSHTVDDVEDLLAAGRDFSCRFFSEGIIHQ